MDIWVKTFATVFKKASFVSRLAIQGEKILKRELFCLFLVSEPKLLRQLAEKFSASSFKTALNVFRGSSWGYMVWWKKFFGVLFGACAKNFRTFVNLFSAIFLKLHSTWQQEYYLWKVFLEKSLFCSLITCKLWWIVFWISPEFVLGRGFKTTSDVLGVSKLHSTCWDITFKQKFLPEFF